MNGAELLVRTASQLGAEVCFSNPGTTEMHLLAALDATPGMRSVLGLFEGVCTGAADGYARMTGKPALTLLHLGPGFANGIANLHNARRAFSPIVNLIGDHPSAHLAYDAPLTSDIRSLASPVSKWVGSCASADTVDATLRSAWGAALERPAGVSTLIVPADCAWNEVADSRGIEAGPIGATSQGGQHAISSERIEAAAKALAASGRPALLIGGDALSEAGLSVAGRIAKLSGASLFCDTFAARVERGGELPAIERIPYFPEQIEQRFAGFDRLVIVGTREPVAFFGYRDGRPKPVPDACMPLVVCGPEASSREVLEGIEAALRDRGNAGRDPALQESAAASSAAPRPMPPSGRLDPGSLGQAIAALQPEGAIIVDEGATSGLPYWFASQGAPRHTYLSLTGGAIGQGMPCATGAAFACRDRRVISLQADGSALYTAQALWTQAREGLDVTTVICANHEYRILRVELARSGVEQPGADAEGSISLRKPEIDWVSLSRGFGVPAVRVGTADELVAQLRAALGQPGPKLIEAHLA